MVILIWMLVTYFRYAKSIGKDPHYDSALLSPIMIGLGLRLIPSKRDANRMPSRMVSILNHMSRCYQTF
jgi:hypothetical protein